MRLMGFLLLLGCATAPQVSIQPSEVRPVYDKFPMPDHIEGIAERLNDGPKGKIIRVLTVHGMLTDNPGFSDKWQAEIGKRIGLASGKHYSFPIKRGYDFVVRTGIDSMTELPHPESILRITRWYDKAQVRDSEPVPPDVQPRIIFYELVWAPFRDEIKNTFLGCFQSRTLPREVDCSHSVPGLKNTDGRDAANAWAQDNLMVKGFGDATLVLSPLGDVLRDDFDLAMCLVANNLSPATVDTTSRCVPVRTSAGPGRSVNLKLIDASPDFFVISHSLGSFLIMDGQQRSIARRFGLSADKDFATPYSLLDKATVFMFANQVSLLELGRFTVACRETGVGIPCDITGRATQSGSRWIDQASAKAISEDARPATKYVAFNDANDLLDFELPPYLPAAGVFGPMINVTVRNPGGHYLLLKDPFAAHTRYGDNIAVINAVVSGLDIPKWRARPRRD
jgi:hypothetical protein